MSNTRSSWVVEKWNGSTWVNDGTIYRPNQSTSIDDSSNQVKTKMADGSNAFFTPEIAYTQDPITLQWLEIYPSDPFIAKMKAYLRNGDYIRFTTHLGEVFAGNLITFGRVWLISVTDTFDLQATFEITG